jgi:hypothetical protein
MSMNGELDEWLALVRKCKYLPEAGLKKLCDRVSPIGSCNVASFSLFAGQGALA